jgi:DNA-binding PadR family transcriptional regulator
MNIPEITHLQFLVLGILMDGEQTGRYVRAKFAEAGHQKNGPAFYQFMARLEDAKFVEGRYDQKIVEGQIIKERIYKITGAGVSAWENVRDFYLTHAGLRVQGA